MGYRVTESKFGEIVEKIYAAADDGALWESIADDIAYAAGAVSCSLQVRHGNSTKIIGASGYKEFDASLYEQHYAPHDLRARVLMGLPADQVHLLHHYMSQDDFVRSKYYNEFFRKATDGYWSAATWITLNPSAGIGLGIGVHRSRRTDPEDDAQVRILNELSPHLRRAGRLHMKLNAIELRLSQLSSALDHLKQPAILADSEGRMVMKNAAAERLFTPPHILGIDPGGRIITHSAIATKSLREAIDAALRPPNPADARQPFSIIVHGDDDRPRIALSVLPLDRSQAKQRFSFDRGSIMILVQEFAAEAPAVGSLTKAFGLSPAESRLAALLAGGSSLRQASETLGVSYSTVMSQVKSCFQKTGTHRQADLVTLAIRLGSMPL